MVIRSSIATACLLALLVSCATVPDFAADEDILPSPAPLTESVPEPVDDLSEVSALEPNPRPRAEEIDIALPAPELLFLDNLFQSPPAPSPVEENDLSLPAVATPQVAAAPRSASGPTESPDADRTVTAAPVPSVLRFDPGAGERIGAAPTGSNTAVVGLPAAASPAVFPVGGADLRTTAPGPAPQGPVGLPAIGNSNVPSLGASGTPRLPAAPERLSNPVALVTPLLNESAAATVGSDRAIEDPASLQSATPLSQEPAPDALRYATVPANSEIRVVLPGKGWLYVGRDLGGAAVQLLGKESSGDDEAFTFAVPGGGEQTLWFQQQDAASGALIDRRLALDVAESGETDLEYRQLATSPVTSIGTGSVAVAPGADLAPGSESAGRPSSVTLAQLLRDPGLATSLRDDTLVESLISELDGRPEVEQRAFWRLLSGVESSYAPSAREWILRDALSVRDDAVVAEAIHLLEEHGELHAISLDDVEDVFPRLSDATIYLLASESVAPGPGQNVRLAARAFEYIVDLHPLSAHWDSSREQLQYLRRHFLDIR